MSRKFKIRVTKTRSGPIVQVFQQRPRGTKIARSLPIPLEDMTVDFITEAVEQKKIAG